MLNSTRLFVWLCCVTSLFFIKAEENFELWNRTSQTVYFTFKLEIVTKLAGETKVEYVTYELSPLGKDVAVHATLTQPITLYITKEQPKEPGGSVVALEAQINPNTGKTFYLEIIPVEGSTFALRPQPKPTTLFGFTVSGATESKLGHSLSNNATDKDIIIQKATYTKPKPQYIPPTPALTKITSADEFLKYYGRGKNPGEILGVQDNASPEQIREAANTLMSKWGTNQQAHTLIYNAYNALIAKWAVDRYKELLGLDPKDDPSQYSYEKVMAQYKRYDDSHAKEQFERYQATVEKYYVPKVVPLIQQYPRDYFKTLEYHKLYYAYQQLTNLYLQGRRPLSPTEQQWGSVEPGTGHKKDAQQNLGIQFFVAPQL